MHRLFHQFDLFYRGIFEVYAGVRCQTKKLGNANNSDGCKFSAFISYDLAEFPFCGAVFENRRCRQEKQCLFDFQLSRKLDKLYHFKVFPVCKKKRK